MRGNILTACRRMFFLVPDSGFYPEPVQFLVEGTETLFHDNGHIFPVALYRICQFADLQVRVQVKFAFAQCCPDFSFQFILDGSRKQAAAFLLFGQDCFHFFPL